MLAPQILESADEIEAARELPRPLFEAIADAGLFHLLVPRAVGGAELDLPAYVQVIEELGRADASTAWAVNQGSVFSTYAARMSREAARAVWADVPRAVVGNSPAPTATAVVVPGGYRVTGKQGFSTGCRHASWIAAYCTVVGANGDKRLEANGKPEARYCLLPVAEAELYDTWTARGMRGTGTHHFAVDDVFVSEARTVLSNTAPLVEPGPLYQVPRMLLFAAGDAAVAIGLARGAIEVFAALAKTPPNLLRDLPMVQADIGHAEAHLRSARAFLAEAVRDIWAEATTSEITLERRAALRIAATHAIWLCVKVVDLLYNAVGASAVFESHPLQRKFQDIHVISQHTQARMTTYELVGRHWLGLPVDLSRL